MKMSAPRMFFWWMVSFMGGVFVASFFNFGAPLWVLFLLGAAWVFSFTLKKLRLISFVLGLLVFATAGVYLYQVKSAPLSFWQEKREKFNKNAQTQVIQGKIAGEFERRQKNARFVFKTEKKESILVFTNRYPRLYYGDKLRLKGKVQIPGQVDDFDWQGYLASQGIYKVMFYPQIEVLERSQKGSFLTYLYQARRQVREFFQENFSPYKSEMLRAIILGDKAISDQFRDKLSYSGTNHLVAISGLHIAIFAMLCLNLGVWMGLDKKRATLFALLVVAFFIFQIGFRASAIRAGIMGSILFLGYALGRLSRTDHLLVLAGFVMLWFNPLLLKYSVGFQLSFLALLGIIYLKPFFDWVLGTLQANRRVLGQDILTMTMAAQVGVLPLISYNFGYLSFVAPLANVLILYFMPVLMVSSLVVAVLCLISIACARILAFFISIFLDYILGVINVLGGFSFSHIKPQLSWSFLLLYYGLLLVFIIWWRSYYRRNLTPAAHV